MKHGQIGSLTAAEMAELNRARTAFEPGQKVQSPILNAFGNRVMGAVVSYAAPVAGARAVLEATTATTNELGEAELRATAGTVAGRSPGGK